MSLRGILYEVTNITIPLWCNKKISNTTHPCGEKKRREDGYIWMKTKTGKEGRRSARKHKSKRILDSRERACKLKEPKNPTTPEENMWETRVYVERTKTGGWRVKRYASPEPQRQRDEAVCRADSVAHLARREKNRCPSHAWRSLGEQERLATGAQADRRSPERER